MNEAFVKSSGINVHESSILTTIYTPCYKQMTNRFEWKAPDDSDDDGQCEHHTRNGQDFSDDKHENMICCWKKRSHKSK